MDLKKKFSTHDPNTNSFYSFVQFWFLIGIVLLAIGAYLIIQENLLVGGAILIVSLIFLDFP